MLEPRKANYENCIESHLSLQQFKNLSENFMTSFNTKNFHLKLNLAKYSIIFYYFKFIYI